MSVLYFFAVLFASYIILQQNCSPFQFIFLLTTALKNKAPQPTYICDP